MSDITHDSAGDQIDGLTTNINQLDQLAADYPDSPFVANTKEFFSDQVYADFLRSYIADETIIQLLAPYAQYFGTRYLNQIAGFVQGNETNLSGDDDQDLHGAFSVFDSDTTELEILYAVDFLRKIFVENKPYFFDLLLSGENVTLEMELEEDEDWGGYIVCARLASDDTLLSDGDDLGQPQTLAPIQSIELGETGLASNTLHKILITLEADDGTGNTSDERIRVVGHYYLVLQDLTAW